MRHIFSWPGSFAYVAPEKSTPYFNPTENGVEILVEKITSVTSDYPNSDILIAGDLNARTKDFLDFIEEDEIDFIFGENNAYPSDRFSLPRNNTHVNNHNNFGISFVQMCCMLHKHILNGCMFNDIDGDFTYFANDGCPVVDHKIASSNLFLLLCNFGIADFDVSDYLPIYCSFNFKYGNQDNSNNNIESHGIGPHERARYKWNPEKKDEFLNKFRPKFQIFPKRLKMKDSQWWRCCQLSLNLFKLM